MTDAPLTWSLVTARLAPERSYWVGTTRPDGSPHAAPVWGVVLEEVVYLYTETATVKARNLQRDPRLVLHLEDGEDVLIVNGTVDEVTDPGVLAPVFAAFAAKYDRPDDVPYLPVGPPNEVVLAVRPRSVLTWALGDFELSQERWSAQDVTRASTKPS